MYFEVYAESSLLLLLFYSHLHVKSSITTSTHISAHLYDRSTYGHYERRETEQKMLIGEMRATLTSDIAKVQHQ